MFRGRYQHTVDPKGRLSIPAKFRDVLAGYEGPLVVVPNEIALEVYPFQEWERQERRISEQSQFNAEVRKIGRPYISRAKEVELAGAGRILLPPARRRHTALGNGETAPAPGHPS